MEKTNYEKNREKHQLPEFKELDKEFEIGEIEETSYLLRRIRKKIMGRVNCYKEFLEKIINPETSNLEQLHEAGFFKEKERKEIEELFKRLTKLKVKNSLVNIKREEKEEAEFIKQIWQEWQEIKKELEKIAKKLEENWEKELDKEEVHYFG